MIPLNTLQLCSKPNLGLEGVYKYYQEEGLENRYKRHIKYGRTAQAALEALGFKL